MGVLVLQKLKLLTLQCTTEKRPPANRTKPLRFHCRKALKKLHVFSRFRRLLRQADCSRVEQKQEMKETLSGPLLNQTLKDLFASPSRHEEDEEEYGGGSCSVVINCRLRHADTTSGGTVGTGSVSEYRGAAPGGWSTWRIGSVLGLRRRLLRRAWRPVLVAIPESEPFL